MQAGGRRIDEPPAEDGRCAINVAPAFYDHVAVVALTGTGALRPSGPAMPDLQRYVDGTLTSGGRSATACSWLEASLAFAALVTADPRPRSWFNPDDAGIQGRPG
jgi:hypothetical protein